MDVDAVDGPGYAIRKLLLLARHRLDPTALGRLEAGLAAGDPRGHTAAAWGAKELLRDVYAAPDLWHARIALGRLFDWAAVQADVADVTRLARTLYRWRHELLAYFRTDRASNGKVEAVNGELEAVDRTERGFRNFNNYRTRMLLKTAADWHTPVTPRLRGRRAHLHAAAPAFIA